MHGVHVDADSVCCRSTASTWTLSRRVGAPSMLGGHASARHTGSHHGTPTGAERVTCAVDCDDPPPRALHLDTSRRDVAPAHTVRQRLRRRARSFRRRFHLLFSKPEPRIRCTRAAGCARRAGRARRELLSNSRGFSKFPLTLVATHRRVMSRPRDEYRAVRIHARCTRGLGREGRFSTKNVFCERRRDVTAPKKRVLQGRCFRGSWRSSHVRWCGWNVGSK